MPSPFKDSVAKRLAAGVIIAVILGGGIVWVVSHRQPQKAQVQSATTQSSPNATPVPSTPGGTSSPAASTPVNGGVAAASPPPPSFQMRPLTVARESQNYQWTAEDGRLPDVIRKLAHNEMEEQRMLAENPRIKRRQLVYIKQPVTVLMEQAKLTGQQIQNLVLPGLDGQELPFEITGSDLEPSGQIGTFTGHLAGRPQSTVSLAYRFGREAFTVLSPEDGNNFEAEPREPGQVVVKSIDPDTYSPMTDQVILTKRLSRPSPPKGR